MAFVPTASTRSQALRHEHTTDRGRAHSIRAYASEVELAPRPSSLTRSLSWEAAEMCGLRLDCAPTLFDTEQRGYFALVVPPPEGEQP